MSIQLSYKGNKGWQLVYVLSINAIKGKLGAFESPQS